MGDWLKVSLHWKQLRHLSNELSTEPETPACWHRARLLTHWLLGVVAVVLQIHFLNSLYSILSPALAVNSLSGVCPKKLTNNKSILDQVMVWFHGRAEFLSIFLRIKRNRWINNLIWWHRRCNDDNDIIAEISVLWMMKKLRRTRRDHSFFNTGERIVW